MVITLPRRYADRLSATARDLVALTANVPPVQLPAPHGAHRLAHLHRNVPGVLAEVNSILAGHAVNIEGQLLGTRGEYGYLLTDIAVDYADDVVARLTAMSQTVRLRVLS